MDAAAKIASDGFLELGSWREDDIQRYVDFVVPAMENQKKTIANYTTGYYQQIAGLSKEKFSIPDISAQLLSTEALRNGSTAQMIWERPFKEMWRQLKKGQDFSTALNAGALRAASTAKTEMQLAKRGAGFYARSANDRIIGYIRTLSGSENCALCYVASTQRYTRGDLLPIHPGCDCGELPIYGTKDIGQVIDEENLEKTHEAIAERFGISDRGAREPDYRKIMIHDHTELGPYLGVKGQKFTKVSKAKLNAPLKAPKPVPESAKATFAQRIEPKLKTISAQTIADDIKAEHGAVSVRNLKGKKKVQTLGEKTEAHLAAIKAVGKEIDDEISNRVKKEINDLTDPKAIADIEKQIQLGEQLLAKTKLEFEAGTQTLIARETAKIEARRDRRILELKADGFSQEMLDDYLKNFYNPEEILRQAKQNAELFYRSDPIGKKLLKEIEDYQKDLADYRASLPANMIPGSTKYNQIFAEKAKEVLAEVRDLGNGGPKFIGSSKANDLIGVAKQVYPTDWLQKAAEVFPEIKTADVTRGYFNRFERKLAISYSKTNGFAKGYATTVHEMGHMFEHSVPGIKELEFAFAHQRAALNPKRSNLGSKEVGFEDRWRNLYTGKDYNYEVESAYEIFTTGIESVFAGSNMWAPAPRFSNYVNSSLGPDVEIDDEFRQFVLGVLFGL